MEFFWRNGAPSAGSRLKNVKLNLMFWHFLVCNVGLALNYKKILKLGTILKTNWGIIKNIKGKDRWQRGER